MSNLGQIAGTAVGVGEFDLVQKFTTGKNAGGYTLTRVDLRLSVGAGTGSAAPRVRVVRGAATGSGAVEVASLTADTDPISPGMPGNYAFLAPENTALRPETDYWVAVEAAPGGSEVNVIPTTSDAEDAGSAADWSIDDGRLNRAARSTGAFDSKQDALMIHVSGSARSNTGASGRPEIMGAAAVGHRLEASPGSVMDPDGVPRPHGYRWFRVDGEDEIAIPGATGHGYRLVAADEGMQVRVEMSFTDDGGTVETLASDAYPPNGLVRPAPAPGSGGAALVSNLRQTGSRGRELGVYDVAQKFTTGANPEGYTLTGVDIRLLTLPGLDTDAPRVRVVRGRGDGKPLGRGRKADRRDVADTGRRADQLHLHRVGGHPAARGDGLLGGDRSGSRRRRRYNRRRHAVE